MIFFLFIVPALLIVILSRNNFFFWDSISQVSIPANWYYETGFKYFFLPDELATGHPTITGMYLAIIWKIFGRSLTVSHLAFFPFIYGILFQLYRLIEKSKQKPAYILLIIGITLIDPTLISQLSMMSFDIIQLFFLLWCFNSILEDKSVSLGFAFAGLCMISLRGMISGAGIILFTILLNCSTFGKILFKKFVPYIPGVVIAILFFVVFYLKNHWIIHNTISGKWAQSSEFASLQDILVNIGITGWRLIDFGRIGIWLALLFIIIHLFRKHKHVDDGFEKNILMMAITQFVVIFPFCILYKNSFGHRYFLPVIVLVSICTLSWLIRNHRKKWLVPIVLALFSGWFWVYPFKISTGWDATPAHWPYYKIRKQMLEYIDSEKINIPEIGSYFPNRTLFRYIDLDDSDSEFKEADLLNDEYILYSNVFNLDNKTIDELFDNKKWSMEKTITRLNVKMILFKRIRRM